MVKTSDNLFSAACVSLGRFSFASFPSLTVPETQKEVRLDLLNGMGYTVLPPRKFSKNRF